MTEQGLLFSPDGSPARAPRMPLAPDVCRSRHGGNPNSERANTRVNKASDRERVRLFVSSSDERGATLKEFCAVASLTPNQVSGRFTELVAEGVLFKSGRTREGCEVYVARASWVNGSERSL